MPRAVRRRPAGAQRPLNGGEISLHLLLRGRYPGANQVPAAQSPGQPAPVQNRRRQLSRASRIGPPMAVGEEQEPGTCRPGLVLYGPDLGHRLLQGFVPPLGQAPPRSTWSRLAPSDPCSGGARFCSRTPAAPPRVKVPSAPARAQPPKVNPRRFPDPLSPVPQSGAPRPPWPPGPPHPHRTGQRPAQSQHFHPAPASVH